MPTTSISPSLNIAFKYLEIGGKHLLHIKEYGWEKKGERRSDNSLKRGRRGRRRCLSHVRRRSPPTSRFAPPNECQTPFYRITPDLA